MSPQPHIGAAVVVEARRSTRPLQTLLALVLVSGSLTACVYQGRYDSAGYVGITVDAQGRPVLVAEICHGDVGRVEVNGDHTSVALTGQAQTSSFTLNLTAPGGDWKGKPLAWPLVDDSNGVEAGSAHDDRQGLWHAVFSREELARLRPGRVQFTSPVDDNPRQVTVAEFHQHACTTSGETKTLAAALG